MREISFRIRHPKTKEILFYYDMSQSPQILYEKMRAEYIIEQYTWLKDKNWKEIYEGDIVVWKNDYNEGEKVVERYPKKAAFFLTMACFYPKDHTGYTGFYKWEYINPKTQEIIGNIYENPELLSSNK